MSSFTTSLFPASKAALFKAHPRISRALRRTNNFKGLQSLANRRMETTKSHYEGHSIESYESAFFYESGAYTESLCDLVIDRLRLKEDLGFRRRLVDIGGGTGNFTQMLLKAAPQLDATVVDPFLSGDHEKELDGSLSQNRLSFVQAYAEEFIRPKNVEQARGSDGVPSHDWKHNYHHVLLKEVVHHLQASQRVDIFKGIKAGLAVDTEHSNSPPSILIITRPQKEIDYPLWKEAREVWAANQPSITELMESLESAGFSNVGHTIEPYPCSIPLKRWQTMVKHRFWSTFSNFTDTELEAACENMVVAEANRIDEAGNLHFEDRLVFIIAN